VYVYSTLYLKSLRKGELPVFGSFSGNKKEYPPERFEWFFVGNLIHWPAANGDYG
ncbi:hypothetical protein K1T71_009049, partial [Dendrolimus kikuchii]